MEFRVSMAHFEMIRKGERCVEIRLNDEKRQALQVGDHLTFCCLGTNKTIETLVTRISHYKSFEEMVLYEPKRDIGYPFKTFPEIISIFQEFHSIEEENLYGVVAIRFKKIKKEV